MKLMSSATYALYTCHLTLLIHLTIHFLGTDVIYCNILIARNIGTWVQYTGIMRYYEPGVI